MRSLKSGLLSVVFTGFCGMAAVVGCSAEGASDVIEDTNATDPETDGTQLPPSNPGTSSGNTGGSTTTDGGAKKPPAEKDAGPPPPEPGDPCTNLNEIFKRSCGACGKQEAVCLEGGDAGGGTVTEYGACEDEVVDGCIPGTTEDVACGNCGTAKKTCNKYCAWSTSSCAGQPTNSCKPGSIEYTAAGCGPSTYRKRDCQDSCVWSNYASTCAAPVNEVVLSMNGTVGQTASTAISLSTAKMAPRLPSYGQCPLTSSFSTGDYPYQYVEIKNPTAKSATVTIYTSAAGGGAVIDTVIAGYSTPLQPMDDAARKNCAFGPNDQSTASDPTGDTDFSILKSVPISAGASILVYVSTFTKYSATNPENTTGNLKINVKTDALK